MLDRLIAYAREIVRRRQIESEIDEELAFHIENETEANIRRGMSPTEARRIALRDLGGLDFTTESVRDVRTIWMDDFVKDCRYAARLLRKSPIFTAVAVTSLALAIGGNALVFGVLNALILRPLNLPQAESLYQIQNAATYNGQLSYPDYLDMRDRNR